MKVYCARGREGVQKEAVCLKAEAVMVNADGRMGEKATLIEEVEMLSEFLFLTKTFHFYPLS